MFCISDAFIDGDRIRGSIHNVVDKAFESGIKMSSCINKARLGIGDFVEIKDKEK